MQYAKNRRAQQNVPICNSIVKCVYLSAQTQYTKYSQRVKYLIGSAIHSIDYIDRASDKSI